MAEMIISAMVNHMVSRAISFLTDRFEERGSITAKLQRLRLLVLKIQSAVEEAEGRQIMNRRLLEWLAELIEGMYRGRYVLDTFKYRALELEEEANGEVRRPFALSSLHPAKRIRVVANTAKTLLFGDDDINELNGVVSCLQSVSGDLREFVMLLEGCPPTLYWPITTYLYRDNHMFGRHVEKELIINFLLQDDNPSTNPLGILPIIGHSGVGKTTLVQHVCKDVRVRKRFSLIMLFDFLGISIVGNSETRVVLGSNFCGGDMGKFNGTAQILKQKLSTERFLLVFENVDWRQKKALEVLLPNLKCGREGSKIIFTSDNKHAATIGTVEPIKLKRLPESEYWFFFKAHAFGSTDLEENPRLVAIGQAIAKMLKGSFFGAKILGALLRANPNARFWYDILKSDMWEFTLLGDGLPFIAFLADKFLLPHLWSGDVTARLASTERTTPGLHETIFPVAGTPPNVNDKLERYRFLICKSIFPSYTVYHVARCVLAFS